MGRGRPAEARLIQVPLIVPATPVLRAGQFTARPYQVRADAAIDKCLVENRSTLVVSATGTGKTVLFCMQATKRGCGLVIAHRDSLIRQAADKLKAALGRDVEIEKAQKRASHSNYVVASVQTLKGKRLERFAADFQHIDFIVIDEAHRASAKSYRDVLAAFPRAKVLGVTATPDRSDKVGLKAVFESVADEYGILEATADGWLAPLKWVPVKAEIDLSAIRTVGKGAERDFDQAELDDEIAKKAAEIVAGLKDALVRAGDESMQLIIFTPGVKTAHAASAAINEEFPGRAAVVDGEMEDRFKSVVVERFMMGEIQFLANCNVLTEGFDMPNLIGIFDASPTKSRLRAMQRWGRVTRPWPGIVDAIPTATERKAAIAASRKPFGLVFDLTVNSQTHDVVSAVDVLAGRELPDDVKKRAKRILEDRGGTPADAIEEAERKIAEEKRRAQAAKMIAMAVKVHVGTPRSVFERAGIVNGQTVGRKNRANLPRRPEDYAPYGMQMALRARGIPFPPNVSKQAAKRLLWMDKEREKRGLCRLGGVEWLRNFGIDAWLMTSVVAQRVRDAIIENGRQPIAVEQLGPLMAREVGEEG